MSTNDGGPAFPAPNWYDNTPAGMTLRDYFAAKAMQADIAASTNMRADVDDVAAWAYQVADAMLKARAALSKALGE